MIVHEMCVMCLSCACRSPLVPLACVVRMRRARKCSLAPVTYVFVWSARRSTSKHGVCWWLYICLCIPTALRQYLEKLKKLKKLNKILQVGAFLQGPNFLRSGSKIQRISKLFLEVRPPHFLKVDFPPLKNCRLSRWHADGIRFYHQTRTCNKEGACPQSWL